MKNTATLLLAVAALALSGCVIWPASGKLELAGTRVGAGQLEFIQPGVTTRSNVLSALGAPTESFADIGVIAYAWEERTHHVAWAGFGGGGHQLFGKPLCLLLEFDSADRVRRCETVERGLHGTIRSRAVAWAKAGGNAAALTLPTRFAAVPVPSDQAVIYVYRPGGFEVPSTAVALRLDGPLCGDLRAKECVTLIVAPGAHSLLLETHMLVSGAGSLDVQTIPRRLEFEAVANQSHYVEIKVPAGHSHADAHARLVPEGEALPKLTGLKPW
jgi:hypothetical protein